MNEVFDLSDDIKKLPVLVGLLETTVKGIRTPIKAKIWDDEGTFYATYSHYHRMPPTDNTRQDVNQMKNIATQYLESFKKDSVIVNKNFNKKRSY